MNQTIHFISLGCPKNQVDTEYMVALAISQNKILVSDPKQANIIVVNTCGFIEPAKQESIDIVLQMAQFKKSGCCKTLVMTGCLSQRYANELAKELKEVDLFLGTNDLQKWKQFLCGQKVSKIAVSTTKEFIDQQFERHLIGKNHSAYLKISEGCNRLCSFCSIPLIRGPQHSRTISSLLHEAKILADSGVRELILVAQDSTAYGKDLESNDNLVSLLESLNDLNGIEWIRILYTYPSSVKKDLAQAMATLPKVVPYLDMPIQHIDDKVLTHMKRGYSESTVRETIAMLREHVPNIFLRTTFLCGHPGETDKAHQRLLNFVREIQFDHVGVFPFYCEEKTRAADLSDKVSSDIAQSRADEIMSIQKEISKERIAKMKGSIIKVMVDGPSPESEYLIEGRHAGQAPDIDGVVILTDGLGYPGQILLARVIETSDYDLVATLEV